MKPAGDMGREEVEGQERERGTEKTLYEEGPSRGK